VVEIYLVRHGQNVDNANGTLNGHRDLPLTAVGLEQAREVAQLAKDNDLVFDYIYTSPLIRAKQTAEVIAEYTGSPKPEIINELIERDLGALTGRPHSDITKLSKELIQTADVNYFLDIGESFPDTLKRAQKALDKVGARHKSGKVLLVTHGDIGKMIFAAFHHEDWREVLKHFHLGNSELLILHEDSRHQPHVFSIDQRGLKEKA